MRGIARRHTPSLIGLTGRLRALEQMDRVEDAEEELNPLIGILAQEEADAAIIKSLAMMMVEVPDAD